MHFNGGIGWISHTISTTMGCFPVIERDRGNKLEMGLLVELEILLGITAWEKQIAEKCVISLKLSICA